MVLCFIVQTFTPTVAFGVTETYPEVLTGDNIEFFEEVKDNIPPDENTEENISQTEMAETGTQQEDNSSISNDAASENTDTTNNNSGVESEVSLNTESIESSSSEVKTLLLEETENIDFSKYRVDISEVEGSYGGFIGIGELDYYYKFDNAQPIYNPIYKETNEDGTTTEYIVITNKSQFEAIGSNKPVVGGWVTVIFEKVWVGGLLGRNELQYRSNDTSNYEGDMGATSISDMGGISEKLTQSDGSVGQSVSSSDDIITVNIGYGDTGKKYSTNENYLIANDIDLSGVDWKPWNYSGKIIRGEVTLTNGTTRNPVISNISITEDEEDTTGKGATNMGVGFFGAVYSKGSGEDVKPVEDERPWWDIIGNILGGLFDLVEGLFSTLGGLVTDIIGSIAGWENITTLNMSSVEITGLDLNIVGIETDGLYQTKDINGEAQDNNMPVGSFAGQFAGDVTVTNCNVISTINTVNGEEFIGGFVGKTVGATNYLLHGTTSGLDNTLSGLGELVDGALNFLLPTDDLVTGLISKLGIKNLVPTKYKPVKIANCSVSVNSVKAAQNYAGGFVGRAQGTKITDCHVTNISSVTANSNVGGFAGRIANAYILGLLQGLGVNLVNFPVGSEVKNSTVEGKSLKVKSTTSSDDDNPFAYAGGFAGAVMASDVIYEKTEETENTRSEDYCGVKGLSEVSGIKGYVGGFTGYAGVGDLAEALNLLSELLDLDLNLKTGEDGKIEVPLGSNVSDLLNTILGVNLNAGILSIIGLNPAQLVGCRVEGSGYTVTSSVGSSVGGFAGFLHGGQILEQKVERNYDRVQATDSKGIPLFVDSNAVTNSDGTAKGAVYARLDSDGKVIYEDVHGEIISSVNTVTSNDEDTLYNVYDTVFINTSNNNKVTLMSSFKDENWDSVLDSDGNVITDVNKLPKKEGSTRIVFPVYQQTTTAEGYVQFTYNYVGDNNEAEQITVYRDNSNKYYTRDENGEYKEFTGVNAENLSVDALQVAVDDSMIETEEGTAVTTYVDGLESVKGVDYVGGIAGQAKLCSAVDLLSNLTAVQYERFEINNVTCNGISSGYTVEATGENSRAGGAVGYAMGGDIVNVQLNDISSVTAKSYAGGFGGQIVPGTVAGQDGKGLELLGIVSINNLLNVVDAIHTFVNDSSVNGASGGLTVTAENLDENSSAAGFTAWSINTKYDKCTVKNLVKVEADGYAGGFCAVADSGSIAGALDKTFGGVDLGSVLGLSKVLSIINAIPNRFTNCNVNVGDNGLAYTVRAASYSNDNKPSERINAQKRDGVDISLGSAGGFLGYGMAVQIEGCANENLKSVDATSYAGGFGGFVDIGSVAQIGNAGVLGQIANLTGIATLLDCAVSMIKTSHCQGTSGGYIITAFDRFKEDSGSYEDKGIAGGFIGNFEGSHVEGSYANHIDKIQGENYAGGFIGRMVSGDVAKAADNTSLINDIVDIDGGLLGALEVMVPSVKNSYAKCVPCGGTILSYGIEYSDTTYVTTKIGVAGGFVGLNAGGQIWGNYDKNITVWEKNSETGEWEKVTKHTAIVEGRETKTGDYSGNAVGYETKVYGTGQTCDILQLLKVDANLYAGGYSGYTKAADLASLGDISILDGLLDLGSLLSVGQVVVPTQRNTGVTGPLRNVTKAQMDYFNKENAAKGNIADFSKYYGYTVGNDEDDVNVSTSAAGGYCGVMTTGVIENSIAYDLISAKSIEQSGGFVGAILTGGVAQVDLKNSLLGGLLSGVSAVSENLLGVANAIVPVIKTSGVYGYYSGSQISATNGNAGGFVGTSKGGQIWGDTGTRPASPLWTIVSDDETEDKTEVPQTENTTKTESKVNIENQNNNKVTLASVNALDNNVDTSQLVKTYANIPNTCFTKNLRSVTSKGSTADAGGFVGYMGAASIASLGGLGLLSDIIKLPANFVSLISATVPTVYYADVSAVNDGWGYIVTSEGGRSAGGFAGFLQGAQVGMKEKVTNFPSLGDGDSIPTSEIKTANITATGLRSVTAGDYAGGFFGYADAANTLNVKGTDEAGSNEKFTLLKLLSIGDIAAIELAKSYIYNSSVTGISNGYTVESLNAYAWKTADWDEDENKAACVGGFGGLLKAGVVRYSMADKLGTVTGKNYAGGFVGRMGKSSILKVDDIATSGNLSILSNLLNLAAGVGDVFGSHIQDSKLTGKDTGYSVISQNGYHNIAGGFVGYADVCRIKNCESGNAKLVKSDEIAGGFMGAMSDAMLLNANLGLLGGLLEGVTVNLDLIKANRSKITNVSITGVNTWDGFDIYGGGSSETSEAINDMGYTGGFIGLNFGSTVTNGKLVYADTVKGSQGKINPYVGSNESTALLTDSEIGVLEELLIKLGLKDDWSNSDIENSNFETRSGSTATPSGTTPTKHTATDKIDTLETPHYVSDREADLLVEIIKNTLTIKKELKYEEGAIPNINDFDYKYAIDISNDGNVKTVYLSAGESITLNNISGKCTISERADSVMSGNIIPAEPTTVTVAAEGNTDVVITNTVKAPPKDDVSTEEEPVYVATSGKFVVNNIPTGDVPPEGIDNPCEVLNLIPDDEVLEDGEQPLLKSSANSSSENKLSETLINVSELLIIKEEDEYEAAVLKTE
ncbi:hypothetical protein B5E58_11270 [Tyzzerella sp. An114]|uniref:GLUG motif-containing protein n=1 Tax=Tyzzerella sp. An114 TaxID=1965545 RepID=UPI000B43FBDD|nr:GLUG motif-containing protein [Tyzzerella sp. An114]OUQ56110.1 hypothetical protein B5E58_11270 [Tyzzerella sp. An114]